MYSWRFDGHRQASRLLAALAIAALNAAVTAGQVPAQWLEVLRADTSPSSMAAREACRQPESVACMAEVALMLRFAEEEPVRVIVDRLLRHAAERDHPEALLEFADRVLLPLADSPPASLTKRRDMERRVRRLAEAGHAGAQAKLSGYLGVFSGLPRDYDEALHWKLRAYRGGEHWLDGSLAESWDSGLGVVPNTKQAVAWRRLQLDRSQDFLFSQALASMYYSGRGVPPDRAAAHALWTLSKRGTGSRYDHWVGKKLHRLSLDSSEQARSARIISAMRAGQRPGAVLDREVEGVPWRWRDAPRRPAWSRQAFVWASALEVATDGGARRACAAATGDAPEEVEPIVHSRQPDRVQLRCLRVPLELDCTVPTALTPNWAPPVFDTEELDVDDRRCDAWLRGPASVRRDPAVPLRDDTDARLVASLADAVTWHLPRPLDLWVYGGKGFDRRGQSLSLPKSSLTALLGGRQALVLFWRADCSTCDALAEALHKGLARRGADGEEPADTRLVILASPNQYTGASDARARASSQWEALFERLEGRSFFLTDAYRAGYPPGHDSPLLLVVDRHGMLRASSSGRWLQPGNPAWRLATNPQALLDLALHDTVWRPGMDAATLEQVFRRIAAGRMPLVPERAPDRITLPSALLDLLVRAEVDATRAGIEVSLDLFMTRNGIASSPLTSGQAGWVNRRPADTDRDLRALSEGSQARWVGTAHTHPLPYVFSPHDLSELLHGLPQLVVLPGGHVMLALPTHQTTRVRSTVNPHLTDERVRYVMREIARVRVGMPVPLEARQPSRPFLPQLQAAIAGADPGAENGVSEALAFADAAGIALYVGNGGTLHRIHSPDFVDWADHIWTGTSRAHPPAPEPRLPVHERLMLAMVMRAMAGDREAFCRVRDDDAAAAANGDFTSEVRKAIARAAQRLGQLHPELQPAETALAGFLDDQDLATLLNAAHRLDVLAFGYRAMHAGRLGCLAKWVGVSPEQGEPGVHALAAYAATVLPGLDGSDILHYGGNPTRQVGSDLAFFGHSAKRLGCREIAVQRVQPDSSRTVRCPAGGIR